jgi:uncharacterized protein YecE (DUF72 family)
MTLYIGTSGWSYPKGEGRWDGVFYPPKLADRDKLAFYARYFDSVEINSSFYRPPSAAMSRGWAERTPPEFRFAVKLWQKFTHPGMFKEATGLDAVVADADFDEFVRGIEPIAQAGKLGALLAQFPPSFRPAGSMRRLEDLVQRLYRLGFPLAVELRHKEWTDPCGAGPATTELLSEHGVAWVLIDEPRFSSSIRDVPTTADFAYLRFHGRNAAQWWNHAAAEDRYNYQYAAAEQAGLKHSVEEAAKVSTDVYVFYNNHYRAKAVVNGLEMKKLFDLPSPEQLPEVLLAEYPSLARE